MTRPPVDGADAVVGRRCGGAIAADMGASLLVVANALPSCGAEGGGMSDDAGRRFWESNAARYDRSMGLLGGPLPRTISLVASAASGAARVLEVASGTGLVSEAVAPVVGELLATDYAEAMVERTRARVGHLPNVRCEVRDLYALGEPERSFDVVVAANVLHLLRDLDGGLAAMRRVLRPGGRLVVPTYCHAHDARARLVSAVLALVSFPAQRRFDLGGLVAAVKLAGFAVDCSELVRGLLPIGFVTAVRSDDD